MSFSRRDFRDSYKQRGLCFGDSDAKRFLRAEQLLDDRKNRRKNAFQSHRQISEVDSPLDESASNEDPPVLKEVRRNVSRLEALKRWKKEKEDRQRLQKKLDKPVFKVGVVKHSVYSPLSSCNKENCKAVLCGDSKTKVNKDGKQTNASSQSSRKPNQLSSRKKILPLGDSGRVKIEKTAVAATLTSPLQAFAKKDKLFPTPQLSKKPDQLSSWKKVLPKVDSGKVKRLRPRHGNVVAIPLAPPLIPADENEQPIASTSQAGSCVTGVRSRSPISDVGDDAAAAVMTFSASPAMSGSTVSTSPKLQLPNVLGEPKSLDAAEKHSEDEPQKELEEKENRAEDEDYPVMHSPYITVTRGKSRSASKNKVISECSSPGVLSSTPTRYLQNLSNLLSSLEDEGQRGIKYFRLKLKMEKGNLHGLCDYWSAVRKLNEESLRDHGDLIDSAVGQSKLLLTKKMAQFETLITDCEMKTGDRLVTVDDLEGFWEVMNMQIIDVRKRFCTLEELYLNGGKKRIVSSKKKTQKKTSKNKKAVDNAKPKVETKSSVRALIAAARKKQKEDNSAKSESNEDMILSENRLEPVPTTPSLRTPRAKSASLHQQVLVRESRRKTVTWDSVSGSSTTANREESSVSTITATPRSVLKKKSLANKLEKSVETAKKEVSTVHFQETEGTESSPTLEYSVTPYVRRRRSSRYSSTSKNSKVFGDLMNIETPVQEPARVRRSKRLALTFE
ncbi:guanylate kinase-associated protein mars isoform X2 [Bacillus rossius redtenbacheri]|uniref:guanylate kinase-associated protein mars isoform X2 n=1 Tax=Bacillus rossius redtenbacheri TaxID=93214 RepID=UPI002FDDB0D4